MHIAEQLFEANVDEGHVLEAQESIEHVVVHVLARPTGRGKARLLTVTSVNRVYRGNVHNKERSLMKRTIVYRSIDER